MPLNALHFNNRWFSVLAELPMVMDEESLRELYLDQLKNSSVLKNDLQWFEELPVVVVHELVEVLGL